MPPKHMRRPAHGAGPSFRLGQANLLAGPLWKAWLKHVKEQGSCWLHVAILLTHAFCLRITEACKLTSGDIDLRRGFVRVKPLKRQPEVLGLVSLPFLSRLSCKTCLLFVLANGNAC